METKTILMTSFIITSLVSYAYLSLGQEKVDDEPLISHVEFDRLDTISPASKDYNNYMFDNLPPKYKANLITCIKKIGGEDNVICYDDVLEEILTNKRVSRHCCMKVVRVGKKCYIEIIKLSFRFYQLKHFASQVSFKTNEVWNRCSAEVESPSSSHDDAI
ncbi:unnamed protein product [Eruca vesicaria subsp. sativa]|uniref:Prolamin-like domain-containing protein n=1 Tax=Eruca vesicaria subsp. sativa TaxID=29727 RepID=A0ABC8KGY6_ERUVS|nr:unnamed protein product [Eruca vesicaria subsp. sativa]